MPPEQVFSRLDPAPERLVIALTRLCEREGLEPCETAGMIATALTWPLGPPRDPVSLLQQ
jgi:hypothetical protein